jgi:hypothetical protein
VRLRHDQFQAEWLARAGVELAAAKLLTGPAAFTLEKQDLMPDSKVRVVVEEAGDDIYSVAVDAEMRPPDGTPAARLATARFRRVVKGGIVRLEALAPQSRAR